MQTEYFKFYIFGIKNDQLKGLSKSFKPNNELLYSGYTRPVLKPYHRRCCQLAIMQIQTDAAPLLG